MKFQNIALALALAAAISSPCAAGAAEGGVFAGALEGKQLTEILQKRGLSAEQSLKITSTLSQVADTGGFAPSDKYKLVLDKKGRFSSFSIESGGKLFAVLNEDGSLVASAPRKDGGPTAKEPAPPQEEKKRSWRQTPDGGKILTGTLDGKQLAALLLEKGADQQSAAKAVTALDSAGVKADSFRPDAGYVLEFGPDGAFRRVSVMDQGRLHTVIRDGDEFSVRVAQPFAKQPPSEPKQAQKQKPEKKISIKEYAGTLKDEPLIDLMVRKGVSSADAARAANALVSESEGVQFGGEDRYKLSVTSRGELSVLSLRRQDDSIYTVSNDNGNYRVTKTGPALKMKVDEPKRQQAPEQLSAPRPAPAAQPAPQLVEIPQAPGQAALQAAKPETIKTATAAAPPQSETLNLSWGKTAGQDAAKAEDARPSAKKAAKPAAPEQLQPEQQQPKEEPKPAVPAAAIAAAAAEKPVSDESGLRSGKIGDSSVYMLMKKHGLKEPVLTEVTEKLGKLIDQRKLWDGDEYRLLLGQDGNFQNFALKHRGTFYTVEKTASGYEAAKADTWPNAKKDAAPPATAQAPVAATVQKQEQPKPATTAEVPAAKEKPAPVSAPKEAQPAAPELPKPSVLSSSAAPAAQQPEAEPKRAGAMATAEQVGASSPYMILKKRGFREPQLSAVIDRLAEMISQKRVWDEDIFQVELDENGGLLGVALSHGGTVYTVSRNPDGKFSGSQAKGRLAATPAAAAPPVQQPKPASPAKPREPKEQPQAQTAKTEQPRPQSTAAGRLQAPDVPAARILKGSLSGKPLYIALRDKGLREPALSEIGIALDKLVDQKRLWDNDKYLAELGPGGEFLAMELQHGATVYGVARDAGGKYRASARRGKMGQRPEPPQEPEPVKQIPEAKPEPQKEPVREQAPQAPKPEKPAPAAAHPQQAKLLADPSKTLSGKLGSKPLYIIMRDHGLREPVLSGVTEAMSKAVNQKKLWEKDSYRLVLDEKGAFASVSLTHRGATYTVTPDKRGYRLSQDKAGAPEQAKEPAPQTPKPAKQPEQKAKPVPTPKPAQEPVKQPEPKAKPAPVKAETKSPAQEPQKSSKNAAAPDWQIDNRGTVNLTQPPVPSMQEKAALPQPAPNDKVRTGKLRGRPLYNVLKENSIREPALTRITAAIASLTDIREFADDDTFELVWERSGRVRYVMVCKGQKCFAALSQPDGQFKAKTFERQARVVKSTASGTIRDSLWVSLEAAGVPAPLILDYADIFSGEIDFLTDLQNGDSYAMDWERAESADGARPASRINYAAYSGKSTGLKKAYFYDGRYFDENGHSLAREFLRAPLNYRRISSHFSQRRLHPVLKVYRQHNGVDYAAPAGTPVSAVSDGVVLLAGRNGGLGNCVELQHAGGYVTEYGHLQRFADGVKRGRKVVQGQVIGYVGSTGLSTGPHLDFRIQKNGKFFDYLAFRPQTASLRLEGRQLEDFKKYAMDIDQRYGVKMPQSAR